MFNCLFDKTCTYLNFMLKNPVNAFVRNIKKLS